MFYFLTKSALQFGNHTAAVSPTHKLFSFHLSPSTITLRFFISTLENPSKLSFAASYLISKLGFSPESALSASKHLNFKTPEKPDSVIHIFKHYGFSQVQTFKLVKKYPRVLSCNPEKTLLPKLEFFHSKGVSNKDIAHILCTYPHILVRSLEKCITLNFNFLSNLLQSNDKTIAAAKRYSPILYHTADKFLKPCVDILEEYRVPKKHIASLVHRWPRSVMMSPNHLRRIVEEVREMGCDPLKPQFTTAVMVMSLLSESGWERRLGLYKSWGWSEDDVLAAFIKEPWCMMTSDDKIMAVMDFLVNNMDCEPSFIAKKPYLLKPGLKTTFIPRASVVHFLLSERLIEKKPNLVTLFLCSEKKFLEKFVYRFEEAPQLLKLYGDQSYLSK
ncbi:CGI-12 PROTEIN-RELATED [Salix purpurea]|uniref:CGI-12 PROTEIN-RELATED n=1 Tax=Salix purpurea TaxID=77065 RepID=A0A9Q0W3H0_SALPP|nr:CGI-12 PROTEIN-RELATED [Salix purpurea]